jgi:hypothetical protein
MSAAAVPGGRVALATWTDPEETVAFAALAEALEFYVGADAGAQMRQPWALADPIVLAALLEDAGLDEIEVSQHTRTACFASRRDLARSLVLATPLAQTFLDAGDDRQELILAHVSQAVEDCDGGPDAVCFPMTTNFALAVAP